MQCTLPQMNGPRAPGRLFRLLRPTFCRSNALIAWRGAASSSASGLEGKSASFVDDLSSRRLLFDITGLPGEANEIVSQHSSNDHACGGKHLTPRGRGREDKENEIYRDRFRDLEIEREDERMID